MRTFSEQEKQIIKSNLIEMLELATEQTFNTLESHHKLLLSRHTSSKNISIDILNTLKNESISKSILSSKDRAGIFFTKLRNLIHYKFFSSEHKFLRDFRDEIIGNRFWTDICKIDQSKKVYYIDNSLFSFEEISNICDDIRERVQQKMEFEMINDNSNDPEVLLENLRNCNAKMGVANFEINEINRKGEILLKKFAELQEEIESAI